MSENRIYWDQCQAPPADAMKAIEGGALSGKTDINPQWRYEVMTEMFGPIGDGWKYEIKSYDHIPLQTKPNNQDFLDELVLLTCQVEVFYKKNGEWSAPIPGVGSSYLVSKNKYGTTIDEYAHKKALTDALSVALKMLGVGSLVYRGLLDHRSQSRQTQTAPKPAQPLSAKANPSLITEGQIKRMFAMASEYEVQPVDLGHYVRDTYGYQSRKDIEKSNYDAICKAIADGTIAAHALGTPPENSAVEGY